MSVSFVHLSDIHFGQETGGNRRIHDDVKECLIEDVQCIARNLETGRATGIIVTGDIAFSGSQHEYRDAAHWLDRVANAAGCAKHRIQLVPGNHDIDRAKITEVTRLVLNGIVAEGDSTLDRVLATEEGRELLFRRFSAYRPFSEGYRCPLSTTAEPEEWVIRLAPGRSLRFVRLNSALVCSADDKLGKLLLGRTSTCPTTDSRARTSDSMPPSATLAPRFRGCLTVHSESRTSLYVRTRACSLIGH